MKFIGELREARFQSHELYVFLKLNQSYIGTIRPFTHLRSKERNLYLLQDKHFLYITVNPLFLNQNWDSLGRFKLDSYGYDFTEGESTTQFYVALGYSFPVGPYTRMNRRAFDSDYLHSFECNTLTLPLHKNEEKTAFRFELIKGE